MKEYFTHKLRKRSPLEIVAIVIFGGAAIVGLAILFGFIIMWLWNWLMPLVFGLPTLTYWQAVGLFILLKILIGGCGMRGSSGSSNKDCKTDNKKTKSDFSKWSHYNKFWEEEGNTLYKNYVSRLEKKDDESLDDSDSAPKSSAE